MRCRSYVRRRIDGTSRKLLLNRVRHTMPGDELKQKRTVRYTGTQP